MCLPAADQRLHRSSLSVKITARTPVLTAIEVRIAENATPATQSCSATAHNVMARTVKAVTALVTWINARPPESSRRLGKHVDFWAVHAGGVSRLRMGRVCAARASPPMG